MVQVQCVGQLNQCPCGCASGSTSQGIAVFKDYGALTRVLLGIGNKVIMPAPASGKMRAWASQFPTGSPEGVTRFDGFASDGATLNGTLDAQPRFAGFDAGPPAVGAGSVNPPLSGLLSAPGEAWEFDVTSLGLGATGILWTVFWRDYEGFIPARAAPGFPAAVPLIPPVLPGRVSAVAHPGMVYNSGMAMVQFHNRDTVAHTFTVALFYPGQAAPVQLTTVGPFSPGDMAEFPLASSVLGEGAHVDISQGEATVTTPSMAFACYQDLPLTP